jgi:hypothetical protein
MFLHPEVLCTYTLHTHVHVNSVFIHANVHKQNIAHSESWVKVRDNTAICDEQCIPYTRTGHHASSTVSILQSIPLHSESIELAAPTYFLLRLSNHLLASPPQRYNFDANLHRSVSQPHPPLLPPHPCQNPPLHVLDGSIISHCRRNTSRISVFSAQ